MDDQTERDRFGTRKAVNGRLCQEGVLRGGHAGTSFGGHAKRLQSTLNPESTAAGGWRSCLFTSLACSCSGSAQRGGC